MGAPPLLRLHDVEVDLRSGEVRRPGATVRLQDKALQILSALAERPGEVVTRDELRKRLWEDASVYVDFDNSLNTAVNRLRQALGDSGEAPRFIETLPKRGYRLIAPSGAAAAPAAEVPKAGGRSGHRSTYVMVIAVVALLSGIGWWAARDRAAEPAIVAVLPFKDLSTNPRPHLAEALTDELITLLGRTAPERLAVIARTSARLYADTEKDVTTIGRELGVAHIVEGTLRDGRVNARLVRARDGRVVWSRSHDVDAAALPAIADNVARAVARNVAPRPAPAIPAAAHEAYLEARYLARHGNRSAIARYQDAIRSSPNYAAAHAGLAEAQLTAGDARAAKQSALRALQLDDGIAEAHHTLATIALYYERNWDGAGTHFARAIAVNDGVASVHHSYAAYFSTLGQHDRVFEEIARARKLDPVSTTLQADACWYFYVARRYDDAIAQCEHALRLDPKHTGAHSYLVNTYLARGDRANALRHARRHATAAGHGAIADLDAYWRWRIADLARLEREKGGYTGQLALAVLAAGDRPRALTLLERSYAEQRGWVIPFLNVYPAFDVIRKEPRFQALARRIPR